MTGGRKGDFQGRSLPVLTRVTQRGQKWGRERESEILEKENSFIIVAHCYYEESWGVTGICQEAENCTSVGEVRRDQSI